ncbi:MAG: sensor histidine kinase [Phenylobacterium sp.]
MVPAERTTGAPSNENWPGRRGGLGAPTGRELDHRIANSLQLAVDFLVFQQSGLSDPKARAALIGAAERLVAVGHLHRFLGAQDATAAEIDLEAYLETLAALIGQSTGLACRVHAEPVRVAPGVAQQLGMALNELALNAAKHAYAPGEAGELAIEARRDGADLRLTVADFGAGLPDGFDPEQAGSGLGLGIVGAIARQLGARLEAREEHGARFTLTLPAPPQAGHAAAASQTRSFAPPSAED